LARLGLCNFSTIILCVLILSSLVFAAPPDRVAGAIEPGQVIRLSAGIPVKAQPQYDQGPVDSSLKLGYVTLLTAPSASQQKAIGQLLAEQQDPRSPEYHKWITPEQYAERFGLSPNDIQKITTWLQSQGFAIVRVARAHNFIVFSGTAAQVEKTFQTEIHDFKLGGQTHFSNTTSPSIPSALSGIVAGIRGLNNFRARSHALRSKPNYTEPVAGGDHYWIAPGDITAIYDLQRLYTAGISGTGQTLAVMGETDVYLADLNDFRTMFNLPEQISGCTFFSGTNVIEGCNTSNFQYSLVQGDVDPGVPNSLQDDLLEADIDLEWSNAVAQQAKIMYVNAPDPNGNGVWDSWYYTVDLDLAPVITLSYGDCELGEAQFGAEFPDQEGSYAADEPELKQANLEGITFMNSSGDFGASECDPNNTDPNGTLATGGLAVSYPASSPEVTGVGGTMIPYTENTSTYWNASNGSTGGSAKGYIPEQGWNDDQEWGLACVNDSAAYGSFCSQNAITSWATAQTAFGITAGGGGPSNCVTINENGVCTGGFPQPAWQQNLVIQGQTTQAHTTPGVAAVRFSPDVSLMASVFWPGFIVCTPVSEVENSSSSASICANGVSGFFSYGYTFGGTSIATPMFAGIVTLLNEYLASNPGPEVSSSGLGNINPTLYALAATPANGAFNLLGSSTSTGSNGVYCDSGTPNVTGWPAALVCPAAVAPATEGFFGFSASDYDPTTNYNLVTGLGSVDAYNLIHAWPSSTTPSFTLSVTATPSSTPENTNVVWNGTLTATNGYSGTVTLTCTTGAPSTCTISPSSITPSSTGTAFTVTVGSGTPGTYNFNIQGTDGTITQTQAVSLTVVAPGFTLSAAPASVAITPGGSGGTSTITVSDQGGFSGSVALTASGLPSGVSALFNPTSTASTSVLTLTASGTAAPGPATVTITGTSGSLTATTTISLAVSQGFTLSTPTTPAPALAGETTTSTFNVTATNGGTFVNAVTFACNGLPDATVSCGFSSIAQGASSPQQVTLTIQTKGPNTSGGVGQFRRRADNRSPWLPLSLPLAGVVMLGFAGRKKISRRVAIAGLCVSLVAMALLIACGGGGSSAPVTVSVSQGTPSSIFPNDTADNWPAQTATFTATVSNTSNTAVTWTASVGTIASTGNDAATYTAPTIATGLPGSATITATSASGTSGTATETLKPATVPGSYPLTVTATEGSISNNTSTITLTVQ
jgi:hypothetical protein